MKKQTNSFLTILIILCLVLLFLPLGGKKSSLSDFSLEVFQSLFQKEKAREVFGLDEEEAQWVFSDLNESVLL